MGPMKATLALVLGVAAVWLFAPAARADLHAAKSPYRDHVVLFGLDFGLKPADGGSDHEHEGSEGSDHDDDHDHEADASDNDHDDDGSDHDDHDSDDGAS